MKCLPLVGLVRHCDWPSLEVDVRTGIWPFGHNIYVFVYNTILFQQQSRNFFFDNILHPVKYHFTKSSKSFILHAQKCFNSEPSGIRKTIASELDATHLEKKGHSVLHNI